MPSTRRIPDPLDEWRRCEQRVNRAWKAWQAVGGTDDGSRFRALMSALADEERAAAAVQRALLRGDRMRAAPGRS